MARGKNGRSKRGSPLATIVSILILVVAAFFGIDLTEENPKEIGTIVRPEETQVIQDVDGQLVVHMIDVGQADCFLLVEDGVTALIDCGTRSTGKVAVEYIKELGVTKLDYVIGTHPHDDHMGGMYDVITNFDVGTVIIPDSRNAEITVKWYVKLMSELKTGGYSVDYPEAGDNFALGDATMQVLAAETDVSNTNNYSIVLKVSFGQMDMIMTGDAETEIEEIILGTGFDIDAEILKLGHHGSDTSSSEAFLDAISPDYGLISCKVGNKYEHPIKSTMEKLEVRGVEVYRTDECGSVIMTVTTDNVTFNCKPGDYLSGVELEERETK